MTTQPQEIQDRGPDRIRIHHYETDRLLGKGGSGMVYRAVNLNTNDVVALKVFHRNFFRNRMHIRDISRSLKRFKSLDHPNVVRIYDFFHDEEGIVLVLEYIDGPDLKQYLAVQPWRLEERLMIAKQVLSGLQYLHEHGFTHHDLKPSNFLFTKKGVGKLCDFSLGGNSFFAKWNSKLATQITPMYVSPELVLKNKATPKSDQYSCGIMFYLMFAGRVPFLVDSLDRLYFCHTKVRPDEPFAVNPDCPRVLSDIIMRMIAKNPKERFEDCDQVRLALEQVGRSRI